MGAGFNSLDEKPKAKVEKKAYINTKNGNAVVTGYENTFTYDSDLMSDETAVMALYATGRDQKSGAGAEFYYVRAELREPVPASQALIYKARRFKVVNEVSDISGAGGETMKITGTLLQCGDLEQGTFNISTKEFTAAT